MQSTWPHYALLEITFDANPSQVSWKLENSRSTTVLHSKPFGSYDDATAGQSVKERLDILTEEDFSGDALVDGQMREYRFVIYDQVGVR